MCMSAYSTSQKDISGFINRMIGLTLEEFNYGIDY